MFSGPTWPAGARRRRAHDRRRVLILAMAVVLGAAHGSSRADDAGAGGRIILGIGGYWRQHVTRMPPLVSVASATAAGMNTDEDSRRLNLRYKKYGTKKVHTLQVDSPPPPPTWASPDFDDVGWPRTRGPFTTDKHEIGLLCRRARFFVADPGGVGKLTLQIRYRGGVIAYLNGQEVLRASLPDGPVTPRTPGDDYPADAFFVKTGKRKGQVLHPYIDRKSTEQWALRERTVGPVTLPAEALRKGVNVLAVENHGANYPAACRTAGMGHYAMIGLTQLFLRAAAGDGAISPNTCRPNGVQVWNADVAEEVNELDYGDACEPLRPIRMAGVRNGLFSGQVVVGSREPIAGLTASAGELRHAGGAVIPAARVKVRYGLLRPGPTKYVGGSVYGGPTGTPLGVLFRRFDALVDSPPEVVEPTRPTEKLDEKLRIGWGIPAKPVPGAVAPIWVTVRVPADARAGAYKGSLRIRAQDLGQMAVPIELEVFDWTLPDPPQYACEFSIYQSPDTLAAHYEVPLWSPRHWELIARSVKLIAEVGNHTIIIPLLSKEQVGNAESYVYWVRRADGSFDYDTSVMDRYLDTYLACHDPRQIDAVCLVVWGNAGVAKGNPYQAGKYDDRGVPKQTRGQFTVTALDAATGKKSDLPVPAVGEPAYEAFWRPVLLKVRENLAKRDLAGKMLLGMPADPAPAAPAVAAFRNILPEVGWFVGNHPGARFLRYDRTDREKTVPVRHVERVYTGALPDPAKNRLYGWRRKDMALAFNRFGFSPLCLYPDPSVWAFRMLMEADLASGHRGAGRIGADYWRMPGIKYNSGGGGTFYARYPDSAVGQTGMASNCAALLAAGPDGPVSSVRFENVREGVQTAEAVIHVQKALLEEKVTGEPAERYWKILDERIQAMRVYTFGLGRAGWQDRDRQLFRAAAEVARSNGDQAGQPSPP